MTNYEKNKTQLDMYAIADNHWGVDKDGKVFDCYDKICEDCIFGATLCPRERLKWLQEEYKEEPEVDWSNMPIDTLILVRNDKEAEWEKRYFAGYLCGKVCAFDGGNTSEDFNFIISWEYAKLADKRR